MKAIGKSADNGIKLAQLLEKAPFKNDLNKLRVFLSDIEKSADLQDLIREGKDFTRDWELLEKAGKRDLRKTCYFRNTFRKKCSL